MKHKINAMYGSYPIGSIEYNSESEKAVLKYTPQWIKNGFPLSPHLPFNEIHSSAAVKNFIENLLPEGDKLDELCQNFMISKSNKYALIEKIGYETAGAISFFPEAGMPITAIRYIEEDELADRIKNRSVRSINIWDGKPRLSLAGVQDKLPIVIHNGRYAIGEGDVASTHILKFGKEKEQHLVLNEFFCMKLAKACGLNVADVDIVRFGNEPVLVVKRFDREIVGVVSDIPMVHKKHMIDGCQVANMDSKSKYERSYGGSLLRLGVNFKKLFDGARFCKSKALAKKEMLSWVVFNLCVSNYDSHGKNISFMVDDKGLSVAPMYDIVNIAMYEDYAHEYAMAFGDEFDPKDLGAYNLAEFCFQIDLQPRALVEEIKYICKKIDVNLSGVSDLKEIITNDEKYFVSVMKKDIHKNISNLMDMSKYIVGAYRDHKQDFEEERQKASIEDALAAVNSINQKSTSPKVE